MIYKSISLLCWGLLPIALLTLICFLGSAPLKTFIMLFLNAWGKTGMGNNKGMGLVWGFFSGFISLWMWGKAELHISAHDSEEYGEISW